MIFGRLNHSKTHLALSGHSIWEEATSLLRGLSAKSPVGVSELHGNEMFLNIHTYLTKPEFMCRFEGHRNMIDLQYIIKGGELIDWHLKEHLKISGPYDSKKDFQFYKNPLTPSGTRIHLQAGYFAIFFPEDGHRPQINDGKNDSVLKAVIKIHRKLLF